MNFLQQWAVQSLCICVIFYWHSRLYSRIEFESKRDLDFEVSLDKLMLKSASVIHIEPQMTPIHYIYI